MRGGLSKNPPMMKCGHAANAINAKTGQPCCVICIGIRPGAEEIDDDAPDLSERKARCTYFGKRSADGRYRSTNRSNYGDRTPGALCQSEQPSSTGLPFFQYRSDAEFDDFYCGCHGWD